MKKCIEYSKLEINENTLLCGILLTLENYMKSKEKKYLEKFYYKFKKNIKKDFNIDENQIQKDLLNKIYECICKNKIKVSYHETNTICLSEPSYKCSVTLDNTKKTGGYMFPIHIYNNTFCKPNFVISQNGYESLQKNYKCPYCNKKFNDLIYIENKNTFYKNDYKKYTFNLNLNQTEFPIEPLYNTDNYYILDFTDDYEDYCLNLKTKLKNMEKYKLNKENDDYNKYYGIVNKNILLGENKNNQYNLQIKTSHDFQNSVNIKCSFVNKVLPINNVCIGGGFCRSILLNQEINDIDFYLYGLKNDKEYTDKVVELLEKIKKKLKKENKKYQLLYLYKPEFNVMEILCIDNIYYVDFNDILNNKNKEFQIEKYTFENIMKTEIKHKIQIIMHRNVDLESIIQKFDFSAARVLYDGDNVMMPFHSALSYKYMINFYKNKPQTNTQRIEKYINYGFNLLYNNLKIANNEIIEKKNIYNGKNGYERFCSFYSSNNNIYHCYNFNHNKQNSNNYYYTSSISNHNISFGHLLFDGKCLNKITNAQMIYYLKSIIDEIDDEMDDEIHVKNENIESYYNIKLNNELNIKIFNIEEIKNKIQFIDFME